MTPRLCDDDNLTGQLMTIQRHCDDMKTLSWLTGSEPTKRSSNLKGCYDSRDSVMMTIWLVDWWQSPLDGTCRLMTNHLLERLWWVGATMMTQKKCDQPLSMKHCSYFRHCDDSKTITMTTRWLHNWWQPPIRESVMTQNSVRCKDCLRTTFCWFKGNVTTHWVWNTVMTQNHYSDYNDDNLTFELMTPPRKFKRHCNDDNPTVRGTQATHGEYLIKMIVVPIHACVAVKKKGSRFICE